MKSIIAILKAMAFANTNAASKIYVCATPQNAVLAQADYQALTWVEITSVGMRGELGKKTNLVNYDTWGDSVIQKAKGLTDAGSPDVEVARIPTDPGQQILHAAGAVGNNNYYAFREVRSDAPTGGTGTIRYNRGLVTGPLSKGGKVEDFDIETFTLGLIQEEIVVNPTISGNPPVETAAPAITGTATHGQVLTVSNGTFTGDATITFAYQWFAGGMAIAGATANTFTLTTAQVGLIVTARVNATNASGQAVGFAAPTAAIA